MAMETPFWTDEVFNPHPGEWERSFSLTARAKRSKWLSLMMILNKKIEKVNINIRFLYKYIYIYNIATLSYRVLLFAYLYHSYTTYFPREPFSRIRISPCRQAGSPRMQRRRCISRVQNLGDGWFYHISPWKNCDFTRFRHQKICVLVILVISLWYFTIFNLSLPARIRGIFLPTHMGMQKTSAPGQVESMVLPRPCGL